MSKKSIYKNNKCETEMMDFYDRQLYRLGIEYEEKIINTRFGRTHIVITGPKNAPPLITIHGGNGNTPLNLSLFLPLTDNFRVYAPDVIGFPGKSEQIRLSPKDNSYGEWVIDVLDELGLKSVPFVTSSFSSGLLLQVAAIAPERISKAVLHVPSGIAHGPILPMITKLIIPWLIYMLFPNRNRLISAFAPMMTENNEDFLEFADVMLRTYKMELRGPREVSKKELKDFIAPTFVISAKDDIFFPADRVIPKSKTIFQNLLKIERIDGGHLSSKKTLECVNNKIIEFLKV
ncbi:alpha/beta fold hydrolase [Clostridium estertheticum]|uniref:alpha/beta fold hydrolase n=1 Tax=Clostridium estertheticum TaxID=238834 RepID=UPI001C6E89D6|nr:alpha/beta hydrolase [Clostridium estertheticum]MBW9153497.1 alpha/beta hydrolase [Clostridium estertheticum]WLC86374.1 alpha/beta hydrolase [Clostridium estertheticum]